MRFFRGVLIGFLNIIVSIIYMSLIILLLNKVPLIKNVINNIYILNCQIKCNERSFFNIER